MLLDALLILAGMGLLAFAGDRLIEYASAIAARARLTPAVIGLTVVSAGTSAPELFVSAFAAVRGSSDIALGNVVGSNIANVALVLGACAAVAMIPLDRGVLRLEYPFMVIASAVLLLVCRDGELDREEAAFFVVAIAAFLAYAVHLARRAVEERHGDDFLELIPAGSVALSQGSALRLASGLVVSLVGLSLGAHLMVTGASSAAARLGVSERVIGLTVVALGTSLPELVASLAAAMKRQHDMAVSNVVGSNIFNILLILGVTGLIRPIGVHPRMISLDLWAMLVVAVILLPLVLRGRISRRSGVALLIVYAAYIALMAT